MSLRQLQEGRYGVYMPQQIGIIAGAQRAHNALATRIAYASGLREDELFNLLPASERPASAGIHWLPERFTGREGVKYTVSSRHGLIREVLLPHNLAAQMEARHLPAPVARVCRRIIWLAHYDIGGGQAWTASFIEASIRALGWYGGARMVRISYEKQRIRELHASGMGPRAARAVVLQETGLIEGQFNHGERALLKEKKRSIPRGTSQIDKYREQIEYIRYKLKAPLIEIHLWLRRKHHVNIQPRTISYRLHRWKEMEST